MKRLLSITEYAFLLASVLIYIFTVISDDCTDIILGSVLAVVLAVLSGMRGELYENKGVSKDTVINRVISGGGTALVIVVISGSLAYCLSKTFSIEADWFYFPLLFVGVLGSLAGPIRGLHH